MGDWTQDEFSAQELALSSTVFLCPPLNAMGPLRVRRLIREVERYHREMGPDRRLAPYQQDGQSKGRLSFAALDDISDLANAEDGFLVVAGGGLILTTWSKRAWLSELSDDGPGVMPGWSRTASARFSEGMPLAFACAGEEVDDGEVVRALVLRETIAWWIPMSVVERVAGRVVDHVRLDLRTTVVAAMSPVLRSLELHARQAVQDQLKEVHVESGQTLYEAGVRPDRLYLVGRSGAVHIVRCPDKPEPGNPLWKAAYGEGVVPWRTGRLEYAVTVGGVVGGATFTPDGPFDESATVIGRTTLYELQPRRLRTLRMRIEGQSIEQLFTGLGGLHLFLPMLVGAMERIQVLKDLDNPGQLALVAQSATLVEWRVGMPPPPPLGTAGGLAIVMHGELLSYREGYSGSDELGALVARYRSVPRGGSVGFPGFRPSDAFDNLVQARRPAVVAFADKERMLEVMGELGPTPWGGDINHLLLPAGIDNAPYFRWRREGLGLNPAPGGHEGEVPTQQQIQEMVHRGIDPVARAMPMLDIIPTEVEDRFKGGHGQPWTFFVDPLQSDALSAQERSLFGAMALSIYEQFSESTLLVRVEVGDVDPPDPVLEPERLLDPDDPAAAFVTAGRLRVGPNARDVLEGLIKVLDALDDGWPHYVFVEVLGPHDVRAQVRNRLFVDLLWNTLPTFPLPEREGSRPMLYATLIPTDLGPEMRDFLTNRPVPVGAARLRLDLEDRTPRQWLALPDGKPDPDRQRVAQDRIQGIGRFARAVTHRRVGVALGGGGAWGMSHVSVLRGLTQAGIPIDMVSGASVGAIMGGLYCTEGLDGLSDLIQDRVGFQASFFTGMVTSTLFVRSMEKLLGRVALSQLSIPFFPVATDLSQASEDPLLEDEVAQAARKSGSLPPCYPPTPTPFGNYVDGGVTRNVPIDVLQIEGARTVFSSNIVPPPVSHLPRPPTFPGTVGIVLADLNPIRRIDGAVRSVYTLLYTGGTARPSEAAVGFEQRWTGVSPFDVIIGPRVIRDTQSVGGFWSNVAAAQQRWQTLKQPRFQRGQVGIVGEAEAPHSGAAVSEDAAEAAPSASPPPAAAPEASA
ncbi:MAG: patatin-like phospholipase family protein [Alphaproteobacteria bacterium]|nr:patatin-like phospholipase family protein [Alphaproteobacteria bacterium]